MTAARIILASRSPRRRQLLETAGWSVTVHPAPIDDGDLTPGGADPAAWTEAMAWLKARAVQEELDDHDAPIIAADTVCAHEGRILGQPRDLEHARSMIASLEDAQHDVWTGLCVLHPGHGRRIAVDRARVTLGRIDCADFESYLHSGQWQGKAGGYNLLDRVDARWPLEWTGEASTIMGLPMHLVQDMLVTSEATT